METEYEAKFYPVDKAEYRKKLLSLGAKLVEPERLMRRALVDSRDYPQLKCTYIRVRDEGNCVRFSAKIHATVNGKVSDQKELDVTVSDYSRMVEMLDVMGFKLSNYQENLRETWKLGEAEIVIDTWPGLEPYSEIEASSESEVQQIAEKLGFNWDKKYITGVGDILSDKYHLSLPETGERLRFITFEKNPFAGLPAFAIINAQSV